MAPCHPLRRQPYVLIRLQPVTASRPLGRRRCRAPAAVNASSSATRASAAWRAAPSWRRAAASCARRLSTSCRDCLRPLLCLLGPLPRLSLPIHPRVRFRKVRQLPSRLRIVKAQPSPGQPPAPAPAPRSPMQASHPSAPAPATVDTPTRSTPSPATVVPARCPRRGAG